MKWREKVKMKWRIDSRINVYKGNPIEHLILCYLYRLMEWFVIVMVALLILYEVLANQWIGTIISLVGGGGLAIMLKSGTKSEYKAYKDCLKERRQVYEQIRQEDIQELRKQAWLNGVNQGKAELKQKLNHKEE
ncbi:hypothetical protein [Oenococcus sp.]|uniref:hypothetical protein n=1 Tax=Oenococcus sp. TaxID=1979414 RepID=UPI0039E88625